MYIIDRKTSTKNATRDGNANPVVLSLMPDMLFSLDIKHINGNVALQTRVAITVGDEKKELSFEGEDCIEYLPEFGKPVDYNRMAKEVKDFVENCIKGAQEACMLEGCYFPNSFAFPEVDLNELSQTIKEGFAAEAPPEVPLKGIPE